MTMSGKTQLLSYGFASALAGAVLVGPFSGVPVHADQSITCESISNQNQYCAANVGNGRVKIDKKLSDSSCNEGKDWGWDKNGIWVSNGCRARFEVKNDGGGGSAEPVKFDDLVGARASSGEDELEARGFRNVDSLKSGNTSYTIWYNRRTRQCLQVATAEGRYDSVTDIHEHEKCR